MRILVAEACTLFREGLCALIEGHADLEIAGQAASGPAAVEQARLLRPDLVVVDTDLPELSGIGVTAELIQQDLCQTVLAISEREDQATVFGALRAGARGYLVTTAASSDLFEAIRSLRAGRSYLSPAVAHHAVLALSGPSPRAAGALAVLSVRECQILQRVAEGQASKQIAQDLALSCRTVETHRANVMRKLGVNKTSSLVRIAIREGLLSA